jgi:hypothetical protein
VISPVTANITIGRTQQFTAIAQDTANVTIPDINFTWEVIAGGGTISDTGLFKAGNLTGTFTNTVKVTATQGSVNATALATVIVTAPPVVEKPVVPPGWAKGEKTGWDGGDVPPGFDNGNKTGWNGGDLPPGFSQGGKKGWDKDAGAGGNAGGPPATANQHANQNKGKSGKK